MSKIDLLSFLTEQQIVRSFYNSSAQHIDIKKHGLWPCLAVKETPNIANVPTMHVTLHFTDTQDPAAEKSYNSMH